MFSDEPTDLEVEIVTDEESPDEPDLDEAEQKKDIDEEAEQAQALADAEGD